MADTTLRRRADLSPNPTPVFLAPPSQKTRVNPNKAPIQTLNPRTTISVKNRISTAAMAHLVQVGWKRVAWPELRIQRLETSRERLPSSIESLRADIRNHAYSLLKKYDLLYRDEDGDINEVLLEMKQQHLEPGTAQPTIIMIACWSSDKTVAFQNLAQEMVAWLAEWTSNVSQRINVEITAPENVQTIYYGAVGDRALSKAWDSTRKSIRTLLDSLQNTRGSLTCLALHKYGVNPNINANPPTVYISMDHCSDESGWHYVATCVKGLLDKQGWNHVQVHIEHNLNMFYTFELLPIVDNKADRIMEGRKNNKQITREYSNEVHIGDDISAARYIEATNVERLRRDPGLGTLGCFVQIKTTNHQEWRTFILTNYHVVRPAFEGFKLEMKGAKSVPAAPEKDSDLWYVDINGYSPKNKHNLKGQVHGMESPSRTKHNFTVTVLKDAIAGLEDSAAHFQAINGQRQAIMLRSRITTLKAELRRKVAFFEADKQAVGKIFLCPAFLRTSNGRRMDWALISVDKSRAWSNSLPGVDDWTHISEDAKPKYIYSVPIKNQSRSLEEPKDLGHVYKFGTTTKGTTGDYSHDQEDVRLADDNHLDKAICSITTEVVIRPGGPGKFCSHGDSGSAVFDSEGGIVGLFFRGHKLEGTLDTGHGYATPIELVFQDIKDFSEQGVTDIRIAQRH